jgi:hypothetical protein
MAAIPEEAKPALRNALIGGLLGAGGGAYAGGPGNRLKGVLAGAGLGALTGGAGTLGAQLLAGQMALPSERPGPESIIGGLGSSAAGTLFANPGLAAGTALGGLGAWKYGPRSGPLLKRLRDLQIGGDEEAGRALARIEPLLQRGALPHLQSGFANIRQPLSYGGPNLLERVRTLAIDPAVAAHRDPGRVVADILTGKMSPDVQLPRPQRVKLLRDALSEAVQAVPATAAIKGRQLQAAGGNIASALRINRILQALPETLKPSRLPWLLAPVGIGAGYLVDKYLKGEY